MNGLFACRVYLQQLQKIHSFRAQGISHQRNSESFRGASGKGARSYAPMFSVLACIHHKFCNLGREQCRKSQTEVYCRRTRKYIWRASPYEQSIVRRVTAQGGANLIKGETTYTIRTSLAT